MENLNLVELLKDAPRGTKLYSPIFGECELEDIRKDIGRICVKCTGDFRVNFWENGVYYPGGECLLFPSKDNRDWSTFKVEKEGFQIGDYVKEKESNNVFRIKVYADVSHYYVTLATVRADTPIERMISVDCLLSKFEKVYKFDPKWLKPFDRVLVRDKTDKIWRATLFSHIRSENDGYPYATCDCYEYKICIPYNEETKNLLGTEREEPGFYKI